MSESQEQILKAILEKLKSGDTVLQLAAIQELEALDYSSPAIRQRLENLAINGSSKSVRAAAYAALGSNIHRFIQSTNSRLSSSQRLNFIKEIVTWIDQGLIDPDHAKVLTSRYNFDMGSSRPVAAAPQMIKPAVPQPADQPVPRPAIVQAQTPAPAAAQPAQMQQMAQAVAKPIPVPQVNPPAIEKPAPTPKVPERPKRPPINWEKVRQQVVEAAVSGALLRGLLYLGAFMFVVSAAVLVIRFWQVFPEYLQLLFISAVPAGFYIGGWLLRARLKLGQAGGVLTGVGAVLVAVDFGAIYQLGGYVSTINGPVYWMFVAIICTALYAFTSWKIEDEFYDYLTLLAGTGILVAVTRVLQVRLEWSASAVTAGAAAMAIIASPFLRRIQRSHNFADACRRLSQILLPASLVFILFASRDSATGQMSAFVLATLGYGALAWGFPGTIFLYAAMLSSMFAVVFGIRAGEVSLNWYATVAALLAMLYMVCGKWTARSFAKAEMFRKYSRHLYIFGLILIGLSVIGGLLTIPRDLWLAVLALVIASLDLAASSYLLASPVFVLFASGFFIVPFSFSIVRLLTDAKSLQITGWLAVSWCALALIYIGLAILLKRSRSYISWLYGTGHGLNVLSLLILLLNYVYAVGTWNNGPTLIALGLSISIYLISSLLHDGGKHPGLSDFLDQLPKGLRISIFIWPLGFLAPIWIAIAWNSRNLSPVWLGSLLAGLGLIYVIAGQLLARHKTGYSLPLHVFAYPLWILGILAALPDRHALISALLLSVAALGLMAYIYDRAIETAFAASLFLWPFFLGLQLLSCPPPAMNFPFAILASLVYIPLGILLERREKKGTRHAFTLFVLGYGIAAYAVIDSVAGRFAAGYIPWIGMATPLLIAALLIYSVYHFKRPAFAWAAALVFPIAFGQALTLLHINARYDPVAWVGLAFVYMLLERRIYSLGLAKSGKNILDWRGAFSLPLTLGTAFLSGLSLALTTQDTLLAFTGHPLHDYFSYILSQSLVVLLLCIAAFMYRRSWILFIEPIISFLPVTLFFIGYGKKLFGQPLMMPQYGLVWSGLGLIHILAAALLDRSKVHYSYGLYLWGYLLTTLSVFWALNDPASLVWTLGLWVGIAVASAWLVHNEQHRTWMEFSELLYKKEPQVIRNAFLWLAAWIFPIWCVVMIGRWNLPQNVVWFGLAVPPMLYLVLMLVLERLNRSYRQPFHLSSQIFTALGLLISLPLTLQYLQGIFQAVSVQKTDILPFIVLQIIAVGFYAASAGIARRQVFAQVAAWLSLVPYTLCWIVFDPSLPHVQLSLAWLGCSTILLIIGFGLDRLKVRYAHGAYLVGYVLTVFSLVWSASDRLTNIQALAITIVLGLGSYIALHFGLHPSFEDLVNRFWRTRETAGRQAASTIFLFYAAYATPVLCAQILAYYDVPLAQRGAALAILAPLYLAIGLAIRRFKVRSALPVRPTWPLYSAAYALTAIGAMVSFSNEQISIYVLILNTVVYAASAYIFDQPFWLYLSTCLLPVIGLIALHSHDQLKLVWVAWMFIGLAFAYLGLGRLLDRPEGKTSSEKQAPTIRRFALPFYAPAFLLSAIALASASTERMTAIEIYLIGVLFYGISAWFFQDALFLYPASWLAVVPYYLGITLSPLDPRWYGLGWLPLIVLYLAIGRLIFHRRPVPSLGKGLLAQWLAHPAIPFYLLAYSLSVSMIALSGGQPLTLTVAFAAAAVIYISSAILFRTPFWLYPGLFAVHIGLLAFFEIHPTGAPARYVTIPFLLLTWLAALIGYLISRRYKIPEKHTASLNLVEHAFAHSSARPFFVFVAVDIVFWQSVAFNGYDTTRIISLGHALLLALLALAWTESYLVYGVVGFGLIWTGAWMQEHGLPFTTKVVVLGGIGLGLYLAGRILEALSARIKTLIAWAKPLTHSAIFLTAAAVVVNASFFQGHVNEVAATLGFAGALYLTIAYRGRTYLLGYFGMALLELAWILLLIKNDIRQPQWYAIPAGLYFMAVGYLEWLRSRRIFGVLIEIFGMAVLLVTSFDQSLSGVNGFPYFVLMLVESLLLVWWGVLQRRKIPFFTGLGASALNIVSQVIVLVTVYDINRWLVGLGIGFLLIVAAVFVEFRREQLRLRTREWGDQLEKWQ